MRANQLPEWVLDMFCNLYLLKNHKIAYNSTTSKAREKLSTDSESLEFFLCMFESLAILRNNQILLNKISHRYLLTTKLYIG
jgi:hypothetical protein